MTEPVDGGPIAWNVECPCHRSVVDFREIKIHSPCDYTRIVPYLREAFVGTLRYCWWIELRAPTHLEDLKKARDFINLAIAAEESKRLASITHDTLTRDYSVTKFP